MGRGGQRGDLSALVVGVKALHPTTSVPLHHRGTQVATSGSEVDSRLKSFVVWAGLPNARFHPYRLLGRLFVPNPGMPVLRQKRNAWSARNGAWRMSLAMIHVATGPNVWRIVRPSG